MFSAPAFAFSFCTTGWIAGLPRLSRMVTILREAGPLASTGASPTGQAALSSPATYLQVTPNDWGGSKGSSLPRTLVQMFYTHLTKSLFQAYLWHAGPPSHLKQHANSQEVEQLGSSEMKKKHTRAERLFSVSALLHSSKPGLRRSLSSTVSVT